MLSTSAKADGDPKGSADVQVLVSKETVGEHFATTANQQTDAFAVIAAAPETSELVIKVVGIVA